MPGYDAFISYSHADKGMAERLSRRLRTYRPPRAARLTRRLVVFRDVERLTTSADVTQELRERIAETRHIILLASPAAAASRYVDVEVAAFLEARGEDSALIVLCDGELATALPAALRARSKEPLYIDLRGADRKRFRLESLRLIAALYGVDYSELRRQDDQERRRRRAAAAVASVAFALLLATGFLITTTPAEAWVTVARPVPFASTDPLMPADKVAINRANPLAVAWLGYNARYARDLKNADDESAPEIREVLIATADPEFTVITNSEALRPGLDEELEANGGEDLWLSLEESDDWATYSPPTRERRVVLSADTKNLKSVARANGLDEALADGLARGIHQGEIHQLEVVRRVDGDRAAAVAVVVSAWDHHEKVGELAPVHLYRGGSPGTWGVADLPGAAPATRIVDVFALDATGTRAIAVTDREGYYRTIDGGASWHEANFGESRVRNGQRLKTVVAGNTVYSLAVLNDQPGDDDNPLFRLSHRQWRERFWLGLRRWIPIGLAN